MTLFLGVTAGTRVLMCTPVKRTKKRKLNINTVAMEPNVLEHQLECFAAWAFTPLRYGEFQQALDYSTRACQSDQRSAPGLCAKKAASPPMRNSADSMSRSLCTFANDLNSG